MKTDISYIDDLIVSLCKGTISPTEKEKLQQWANLSVQNRKYVQEQEQIWFSVISDDERKIFNSEVAFSKFWHQVHPLHMTVKHSVWKCLKYVAVFILVACSIISAFLYGQSMGEPHENKLMYVRVPEGSQCSTVLPDGSTVMLRSGSQLSYRSDYGKENREVELKGEGTFNVRHDSLCPFSVNVRKIRVNDIGTEFTVTAYDKASTISVQLSEGKVSIDNLARKMSPMLLNPGQTAVMDVRSGKVKVAATEELNIRRLKNGALLFCNVRLKEIAHNLEREYGIRINFASTRVANTRYYCTFDSGEQPFTEVLSLLCMAKPFKYKIKGRMVTIR